MQFLLKIQVYARNNDNLLTIIWIMRFARLSTVSCIFMFLVMTHIKGNKLFSFLILICYSHNRKTLVVTNCKHSYCDKRKNVNRVVSSIVYPKCFIYRLTIFVVDINYRGESGAVLYRRMVRGKMRLWWKQDVRRQPY